MSHDAVRGLATRGDADALKALVDVTVVADPFLRRTAIEALGRHPLGREQQAAVLGALQDPSAYVVCTACDVVAQWQAKEARTSVLALLLDPAASTRLAALRAVKAVWDHADFPLVFDLYSGAPEIDVRRSAAWVLREQVGVAHWRALFDAFRADDLPRHRRWACELAAEFGEPDILTTLSGLLADADGHVRKAATRAIGALQLN